MPGLILVVVSPLLAAVAVMLLMAVMLLGLALTLDAVAERGRRTHTA